MGSQVSRYIFAQALIAFATVAAVLTTALWLVYSLRYVEYMVDDGLPLATFIELVALILPRYLGIALPIALFCAILFVYHRLLSDSELVVLRASGASDGRLASPAIALALLVATTVALVNLSYAPAAARAFRDLQFAIRNNIAGFLLQPGVFKAIRPGITFYVREHVEAGEFEGILIQDDRDPMVRVTMMAERGTVTPTATGVRVVLADGNRQQIDPQTGKLSLLYFDRYTAEFRLTTNGGTGRERDARELSLGELLSANPDELGRDRANKFRAEGHARLSSPLQPIALTVTALAALLIGPFDRRSKGRRLLVAVGSALAIKAAGLAAKAAAVRVPAVAMLLYAVPLGVTGAGMLLLLGGLRRSAPDARAPAPA